MSLVLSYSLLLGQFLSGIARADFTTEKSYRRLVKDSLVHHMYRFPSDSHPLLVGGPHGDRGPEAQLLGGGPHGDTGSAAGRWAARDTG